MPVLGRTTGPGAGTPASAVADGASGRSKMTGLMLIDSPILSGKPAEGQSFLPIACIPFSTLAGETATGGLMAKQISRRGFVKASLFASAVVPLGLSGSVRAAAQAAAA